MAILQPKKLQIMRERLDLDQPDLDKAVTGVHTGRGARIVAQGTTTVVPLSGSVQCLTTSFELQSATNRLELDRNSLRLAHRASLRGTCARAA